MEILFPFPGSPFLPFPIPYSRFPLETAGFRVSSAYEDIAPVSGLSVVIAAAHPRRVSPCSSSDTPTFCGKRRASSLGIVPANRPPSRLLRNVGAFNTVQSASSPLPSLTWMASPA